MDSIKPSDLQDKEKVDYLIFLLKEVNNHAQSFNSTLNRLRSMQDNFDKQHNDIYHMMECVARGEIKMSGGERMKMFNKITELEKDRRFNKNLLEKAEILNQLFLDNPLPMYRNVLDNECNSLDKKHQSIHLKSLQRGKEIKETYLKESI